MKTPAIIIAVLLLTGCATTQGTGSGYSPIVDQPNANYNQDLRECQQHADKATGAGDGAVAGALGGAAIGALFAMAVGGREFAGYGAKVGALSGAVGGAASGERDQRDIIKKCLQWRGHNVLQ